MRDLGGKVAVVTGAASGIGLALATRFAAEGMDVVLADIEGEALDAAVAGIGGSAIAVRTDVSDGDSVDALRDAALERFGAVHIVCNNAGVGGGGPIADLTTADWEWVLGVNLWGVIHGLRAFLPTLVAQGEGHVVNTASMAGMVAGPGMGPYNASKFAVVGISETLHREMAGGATGVGVSVLCPGWVATNIVDSDRNRPNRSDAWSGDDARRDAVRAFLATGMAPAAVAERVVQAIVDERFYILTHPEMKPAIESRMRAILAEEDPGPARFT